MTDIFFTNDTRLLEGYEQYDAVQFVAARGAAASHHPRRLHKVSISVWNKCGKKRRIRNGNGFYVFLIKNPISFPILY